MIHENGDRLVEADRFAGEEELIFADVDLDRIIADRSTTSSYGDSIHDHRDRLMVIRRVEFELGPPAGEAALRRRVDRFPYVPSDPASRNERCEEVYNIQVRGLPAARRPAQGRHVRARTGARARRHRGPSRPRGRPVGAGNRRPGDLHA